MLDMGFIRDIRRVLAALPAKRQNLLFSATFSDEIKALADGLLDRPALIEVARRNTTAELIAQKIHPVDRERKRELLEHLITSQNWHQVLVFTRTKHGANRLAEQLNKSGITALAIHGNKSQGARTRALAEFKQGTLQVLVATDIAARGIDIDQLPHVVNFELPEVAEDYVHRIGRTGRAGASGEAVSLVCVDERDLLASIEKLIKRSLPREVVAGFEPDPHAVAQPIRKNSRQGAPGRSGGQRAPATPAATQVLRIKNAPKKKAGQSAGQPGKSRAPGKPASGQRSVPASAEQGRAGAPKPGGGRSRAQTAQAAPSQGRRPQRASSQAALLTPKAKSRHG